MSNHVFNLFHWGKRNQAPQALDSKEATSVPAPSSLGTPYDPVKALDAALSDQQLLDAFMEDPGEALRLMGLQRDDSCPKVIHNGHLGASSRPPVVPFTGSSG
jgi:hypothetical protein